MTQDVEQPPSPQALKQGYEPPDVSNRGLLIFFIIFVLFGAAVQAGVWMLTKYYLNLPRTVDAVTSAAPPQERFVPPHLQPIQNHNELPREDLADLRREKAQIFKQLGWKTDPDTGVPVIPDQIVNELAKERRQNSAATKGGQP